MGSFNNDYIIYIREQDGTRTMFSAGELRDRLCRCIGDSSTADDITLALEYSLVNRSFRNRNHVFDRGEIDAAVVRLLEETGFPDAAQEYRSGGYFEDEEIETDSVELLKFLHRHLGCGENVLGVVTTDVRLAAEKIGITAASPHLFLEMGRYFAKHREFETALQLPEVQGFFAGDFKELAEDLLSNRAKVLWNEKVFDAECVNALFPCVRFHVNMEEFSRVYEISSPVTELLVYPAAAEVSAILEECRKKLQNGRASGKNQLPCTLVIHDLRRFVLDAYECSDEQMTETLALELGEVFALHLGEDLFKLDFD